MSTAPEMTEKTIVSRLLSDRWGKSFCLPNYTPPKWWECDMFERTSAGYFREYEVKITVADFRRDGQKATEVYNNAQLSEKKQEKKFELLAAGDPRGPSQFFYVTPEGLLDRETLPPWAGWIEIYSVEGSRGLHERVRVKAPQIHRIKLDADPNHHRGTCYFRFHRLRK